MKEERDAVFRRKYDFWPSFYQHSLFAKEVKIIYFEVDKLILEKEMPRYILILKNLLKLMTLHLRM